MKGNPVYRELSPGKKLPYRRLYTGSYMPGIGMGTFGSDKYSNEDIAAAVDYGIGEGYRLIDCAACYGNEDFIGPVLEKHLNKGLKREDLFVISKVWNDMHAYNDVIASCKKSLKDLKLDYLDCYLVHWPFPNYHAPGCDVNSRNPGSRPYIHEEFMETWRAMEALVSEGLVKHIGTSNVTIPKLRLILRDAKIKPAVNEMELHPCFQQGELFQFCLDNEIQPIAYSPIGSPARPERDRTPEDYVDTEMEAVVKAAKNHGIHPAAVCIKWAVQRGQIPIPFSTNPRNISANLSAACGSGLNAAELDALKGAERNSRLIKGQVFLWEGAGSWLDLWDIDGSISK